MAFLRTRSPIAPTRGFLGLVIVIAIAVYGWHWWQHRPKFLRGFSSERHGSVTGRPRVGDGDGLVFDDARVRISGIDAPEMAQSCDIAAGRRNACGDEARRHLEGLIAGRSVTCTWSRLDKYRRRLGRCTVGDLDLGAAMVRDGWAVAYGAYEAEEAEARTARRGIWSGRFEWPEDWRREHRRHDRSWRDWFGLSR